jgi:hypothetical protein
MIEAVFVGRKICWCISLENLPGNKRGDFTTYKYNFESSYHDYIKSLVFYNIL